MAAVGGLAWKKYHVTARSRDSAGPGPCASATVHGMRRSGLLFGAPAREDGRTDGSTDLHRRVGNHRADHRSQLAGARGWPGVQRRPVARAHAARTRRLCRPAARCPRPGRDFEPGVVTAFGGDRRALRARRAAHGRFAACRRRPYPGRGRRRFRGGPDGERGGVHAGPPGQRGDRPARANRPALPFVRDRGGRQRAAF